MDLICFVIVKAKRIKGLGDCLLSFVALEEVPEVLLVDVPELLQLLHQVLGCPQLNQGILKVVALHEPGGLPVDPNNLSDVIVELPLLKLQYFLLRIIYLLLWTGTVLAEVSYRRCFVFGEVLNDLHQRAMSAGVVSQGRQVAQLQA